MEPAFIIRHFAGKVKYQIKVGGRSDGHKKISYLSDSLCQGVENLLGMGWSRCVLRCTSGFFWCGRWEDNAHYRENALE